ATPRLKQVCYKIGGKVTTTQQLAPRWVRTRRERRYSWLTEAARTPQRRSVGSLAGGWFRSMTSGEHPSRCLERRWAPRYSFRAELEIEWGSAVLRGKTRDISSNGMFIESSDTLWVGARFPARLSPRRAELMICV